MSGAAQTNRCCWSSHEKQTAIKPRASREREFLSNEQHDEGWLASGKRRRSHSILHSFSTRESPAPKGRAALRRGPAEGEGPARPPGGGRPARTFRAAAIASLRGLAPTRPPPPSLHHPSRPSEASLRPAPQQNPVKPAETAAGRFRAGQLRSYGGRRRTTKPLPPRPEPPPSHRARARRPTRLLLPAGRSPPQAPGGRHQTTLWSPCPPPASPWSAPAPWTDPGPAIILGPGPPTDAATAFPSERALISGAAASGNTLALFFRRRGRGPCRIRFRSENRMDLGATCLALVSR